MSGFLINSLCPSQRVLAACNWSARRRCALTVVSWCYAGPQDVPTLTSENKQLREYVRKLESDRNVIKRQLDLWEEQGRGGGSGGKQVWLSMILHARCCSLDVLLSSLQQPMDAGSHFAPTQCMDSADSMQSALVHGSRQDHAVALLWSALSSVLAVSLMPLAPHMYHMLTLGLACLQVSSRAAGGFTLIHLLNCHCGRLLPGILHPHLMQL